MRKKATKSKVKNKNTNRVNIINTIKIGNTKKRSYRKKSGNKSGVSSIVVNVPQSFPQPYYIPTSNPFQIQPHNLPIQNPSKIMKDEMDREIIGANSDYIKSKPVFIPPTNSSPSSPPKIITASKLDDIKEIYSSDKEYFSTASNFRPRGVFFNDDIDSDSEVQSIPLNRQSPLQQVSISKMNQSQLHRLAQQKGIDLTDPETKKKRNMKTLKELLK